MIDNTIGPASERPRSERNVYAIGATIGDCLWLEGGGDDSHLTAGAAEGAVEAFSAATLVDRAEIHRHPAITARHRTNTHQNDIALIALSCFRFLIKRPLNGPLSLPTHSPSNATVTAGSSIVRKGDSPQTDSCWCIVIHPSPLAMSFRSRMKPSCLVVTH